MAKYKTNKIELIAKKCKAFYVTWVPNNYNLANHFSQFQNGLNLNK